MHNQYKKHLKENQSLCICEDLRLILFFGHGLTRMNTDLFLNTFKVAGSQFTVFSTGNRYLVTGNRLSLFTSWKVLKAFRQDLQDFFTTEITERRKLVFVFYFFIRVIRVNPCKSASYYFFCF